MEIFGLAIMLFIIFKLITWILPTSIFTSSSGFWTGFWVYVWSTSGFQKLIVVLITVLFSLFGLLLLIVFLQAALKF